MITSTFLAAILWTEFVQHAAAVVPAATPSPACAHGIDT